MLSERPPVLNDCARQIIPSMIILFQGLKRAYACKLQILRVNECEFRGINGFMVVQAELQIIQTTIRITRRKKAKAVTFQVI